VVPFIVTRTSHRDMLSLRMRHASVWRPSQRSCADSQCCNRLLNGSISQLLSRIGLLADELSTENASSAYLVLPADEIFSKTIPILGVRGFP